MGKLTGRQLKFEIASGKINAEWVPHSSDKETDHIVLQSAENEHVQNKQNTADSAISLNIPVWTAEVKRRVVSRLAAGAGEVYELLQDRLTDEALAVLLLPKWEELEQGGFEEKDEGQQNEWLRQLYDFLLNDPWQAFLLRGLTQAEMLDGVFSSWSKVEPDHTEADPYKPGTGELAAELARLERKGPPITSGEWLAEAAAEGSLHQPGTQFHEIAERELPSAPVHAEVRETWERLLPQTPRAREGLELVLRRVSEAAVQRANGIRRP